MLTKHSFASPSTTFRQRLSWLRSLCTALVLVLLLGGTALAKGHGHGPRYVDLSPLNLTPTQERHFQDVDERFCKVYRRIQPSIQQRRQALREALLQEDINAAEVSQLRSEIDRDVQYLHRKVMEGYIEKRNFLTPKQEKLYMELVPMPQW